MIGETQFVGVEVVIKTNAPCNEFVQYFANRGEYVSVLSCDTHKSHVYFQPLAGDNLDTAIQSLCKMIAALPELPRHQWNSASFREFFIGYEIGEQPFSYDRHLSCETLSQATALGAGVGFALYSVKSSK